MDHQKIKNEFLRIKSLGYLANVKSDINDGAAGNTFEHHLGVKENNLRDPDFEQFEVKTKKQVSKAHITLFSQKPTYPSDGDNYMRNNYGIPDEEFPNINVFRTSIYAHRWSFVYNRFNFKIDVNFKDNKVYVLKADKDFKILDKAVYWDFQDIINGTKKLNNLFVVKANEKLIGNKAHFEYPNASVFIDYIGDQNFINLLSTGVIRYDNRLGIYRTGDKTGSAHNHGGAFRIAPKDIGQLFKTKIEI